MIMDFITLRDLLNKLNDVSEEDKDRKLSAIHTYYKSVIRDLNRESGYRFELKDPDDDMKCKYIDVPMYKDEPAEDELYKFMIKGETIYMKGYIPDEDYKKVEDILAELFNWYRDNNVKISVKHGIPDIVIKKFADMCKAQLNINLTHVKCKKVLKYKEE